MIIDEYIKFINENNLGNLYLTIDEQKHSFKGVAQSFDKAGLICNVIYNTDTNKFLIEESDVCINFYSFKPLYNVYKEFLMTNEYKNIFVDIDEVKREVVCKVMTKNLSTKKYRLENGEWITLN